MQELNFAKKMVKMSMAVAFVATMSACGAMAPNTDKPSGIYLGGADGVSGDYGVQTSDVKPSQGAQLTGISCKNKLWEPSPTNEVAISVLKRQASAAGFNSVYVTSVEADPNALAKNCWAAIIATGLAFNS